MTRGVKEGTKRGSYKTAPEKTKSFCGYRYTEKEYQEIRKAIEDYAGDKTITKSRALYELITKKAGD